MTATLVGIGLVGGATVATVGYQSAGSGPATRPTAVVALPTARPTVVENRLQPCEAGWRLSRAGVCVRVVKKVLPAVSVRAEVRSEVGSQQPVAAPHREVTTRASRSEESEESEEATSGSLDDSQEHADESQQHEDDSHEDADHEDEQDD